MDLLMDRRDSKKRFWLKVLLGFFLVFGSFCLTLSISSPALAKAKYSDQKEYSVYITKTGKKYHRAGCRYLRYSKYKITKSEALERGYAPCKVCRP